MFCNAVNIAVLLIEHTQTFKLKVVLLSQRVEESNVLVQCSVCLCISKVCKLNFIRMQLQKQLFSQDAVWLNFYSKY